MVTHRGTITLNTPRLLLRRVEPVDAEPMFQNWASDARVTEYLTWPPHGSLDVTRSVIESWIQGYDSKDFYQWVIVLKDLGQPIGSISVVHHNDTVRKAEIGYCIGVPWWGQGITAEALQAVIGFLFDQVNMNRVEACHDVKNPNSGKVMKKCGMILEGILRQADVNRQGICDICVYSILKE